jgi:hypothetical protein
LGVVEQKYIVGEALQDTFEPMPLFGTTGLFELTKLPKAGN